MSGFDDHRRRAGLYAFLLGYALFMLLIFIANAIQNHQNGGGWAF